MQKFWAGAGKVQRKKGAAAGEQKAPDFYCEKPKIAPKVLYCRCSVRCKKHTFKLD